VSQTTAIASLIPHSHLTVTVASRSSALPSRAVPVLDDRGRLERATRREAGKSARRFRAASSVSVIRVDLKSPPAMLPPAARRFSPFGNAQGALSPVEARTEAGRTPHASFRL